MFFLDLLVRNWIWYIICKYLIVMFKLWLRAEFYGVSKLNEQKFRFKDVNFF